MKTTGVLLFSIIAATAVLLQVGCQKAADATDIKDQAKFDWPVWRGPDASGVSRETDWNAEWNDSGPPVLWKANIGVGFASMAVADGRVFAMGYADGIDTVYCFSAADGKELWKHSYPCQLVDNLHEGGPAATPTIDGDTVYTISKEGQLFAFNVANGEVRWELRFPELLEVKMPEWGFSGSALIVGEKLIVEAGRTCALDKKTGKLIWKTDAFKPGYGSPTLFKSDGEELIAVLNNEFLMVVRLSDGEILAKQKWETSYATSACTPLALGDGNLFISTGYGKGCLLAHYKAGTLTPIYENKNIRSHMANVVPVAGNLYGVDGQSNHQSRCKVVCMDEKTGDVRWEQAGFGCGNVFAAGDRLIIFSDEGELVTAKVDATSYQEISRAQILEGKCWTVPVLSNQRIFCRNATGDLVCLDVSQ
ncbi:MAG: PQQ-binding-like beta-propeller repeat protein [Planctomycetota bacterium]|nr:PQQ-binding-like beta-propeller repeat protein [Planctomycetota bacterium]